MSGVGDRAHIAAERIVRRQPVEKNSAIAGDDRQQIVEIVRDAAGQLADGFHLLRLTQLCLELQAIADVGDAAANQDAARVGQARQSDLARDVAPVTRAMGPIEERRPIDNGLVKVRRGCVNRSPAVRLELRADINRRLRHQFLCGPPEHVDRFLVVLDEASESEVHHHDRFGCGLDQRSIAILSGGKAFIAPRVLARQQHGQHGDPHDKLKDADVWNRQPPHISKDRRNRARAR